MLIAVRIIYHPIYIHIKKVIGQFLPRIFFAPFLELKGNFARGGQNKTPSPPLPYHVQS